MRKPSEQVENQCSGKYVKYSLLLHVTLARLNNLLLYTRAFILDRFVYPQKKLISMNMLPVLNIVS